jgi:hypothetical protein
VQNPPTEPTPPATVPPIPLPKPAPADPIPEPAPVTVPPVIAPPVPEPPPIAEAGVTTSEWKLALAYLAQGAAIGTADLVNIVSKAVWHVSVTIPPDLLQLVVNLEFAAGGVVGLYAVSRGIRKLGAK